jgi:hypothetical protein
MAGPDQDRLVRLGAFTFLRDLVDRHGEVLPAGPLREGFVFQDHRVPLQGPQGIFKPAVMSLPLSITTAPVVAGHDRPYEDELGPDGFLRYRYRGTDSRHRDNVGLRTAMSERLPLVYFLMRINRPGGGVEIVDLAPGHEWLRHPIPLPEPETAVDVAADPLGPDDVRLLAEGGYRWVPDGSFVHDLMWGDADYEGIGIGDEVAALGLLRVFTGSDRNVIVARTGNVAMQGHEVMGIRRRQPDGGVIEDMMELCLAEIRSIQGESGSPVFVTMRAIPGTVPRIGLLGLLIGHWTEKNDGENRENLGIGHVVPASKLTRILRREDVAMERQKRDAEA